MDGKEIRASRVRILVYGFVPFGAYQTNRSEMVVRALPRDAHIRKVVFPVRFDRAQFLREIALFRPTHVLGLGQCPRGRMLRVETRAVNCQKEKGKTSQTIDRGGPESLSTSWRIAPSHGMRVSRNAGTYVCNFSMYVIARQAARDGFCSAFLHIPVRYDPRHAEKVVWKIIQGVIRRVGSHARTPSSSPL